MTPHTDVDCGEGWEMLDFRMGQAESGSLRKRPGWWRSLVRGEGGQVLPWVAVGMIVLLGGTALVVDVGNAMVAQRELQASTDAAALAGAGALPSSNAVAIATQYSSVAGGLNTYTTLSNVTMAAGYPVLQCLTTLTNQGVACSAPATANAVVVRQQVSVPLYFGRIFGNPTWTLTATSTASAKGGAPSPFNVALVIDTTLSMAYQDADCGATQIACALAGARILLQSLNPCALNATACTITNGNAANSVDRVSVFTFPQQTSASAGTDYNCGSAPVATTYTFPAAGAGSYSPSDSTYQITPFHSDYKTSDKSQALSGSSNLVAAAGGLSGCTGMAPPSNAGQYGTYYAATMYSAQSALLAEQAANPGSQNVMIILGDGDSNAPQVFNGHTVMGAGATANGSYPSWYGECGQAVTAAQAAAAAGTRVYTIAYGALSTGCTTDVNAGSNPNISPCDTLAAMASAPEYFFSDYKQSGSNSTCVSAQPVTSLNDIFTVISSGLTTARLIPNGTT